MVSRHLARALICAGLCAGLFRATPAHAGGKKVKAHLECLSGDPIKSGKAALLGPEMWCTIRIDDLGPFKLDGLVGTLSAQPGKNTTLKTMPGGMELKGADTQDGPEFRLDAPWVADTQYKVCEPFQIVASLHDAANRGMDDEVWEVIFKVAASCPKPKKVAGALKCHYTAQDGTSLAWPGNGAKLKPRMESTFYCSIVVAKPEKGVKYEVSLGIDKKGTPKKGGFELDQEGMAFFENQFEEEVYQACSNFTVVGSVAANGASLWSGKLAVKQDCPD